MEKTKNFVIWLDGYLDACGSKLNQKQTEKVKEKLNNIFEHEAETLEKPTLEELGEQYNFDVNNSLNIGQGQGGETYRC